MSETFVKASDCTLLFQQLLRMILKTDAGRNFILQETNGIAAEMLNWQEQHQCAFGFFPLLGKKRIEYYCSF